MAHSGWRGPGGRRVPGISDAPGGRGGTTSGVDPRGRRGPVLGDHSCLGLSGRVRNCSRRGPSSTSARHGRHLLASLREQQAALRSAHRARPRPASFYVKGSSAAPSLGCSHGNDRRNKWLHPQKRIMVAVETEKCALSLWFPWFSDSLQKCCAMCDQRASWSFKGIRHVNATKTKLINVANENIQLHWDKRSI